MAVTIGTMKDFKKLLPDELADAYASRQTAIGTYLSAGGVTKFEKTSSFPRLVYPTIIRLESQIRDTERKLKDIDKQTNAWHKRHAHLKTNKATDLAKRAADPLYWEHRTKLVTDPSYRKTYELVRPPIHLLNREKWRKRLKMFIKSEEHRLRLREARVSKIGKKRAPMAEEVETRFEFNRKMAQHELEKLNEKRKLLKQKHDAMQTMLAWAKASH